MLKQQEEQHTHTFEIVSCHAQAMLRSHHAHVRCVVVVLQLASCMAVALLVAGAHAATTEAPHTTPKPTPVPTTPSPTPFPLPEPAWGTCPTSVASIFMSCATVTAPQRWTMPAEHSNLTFFLGRVEPSNAATPNTTVWYLGDDCLVSGLSQWVSTAEAENFYVVGVYPRGSVYATPQFQCAAADTDSTTGWPLPSCGTALNHSGVDASVFSATEMAHDLKYVVPILGTAVNVVFADGLSTVVAQRLQWLAPTTADAYLLSGFTAPDIYDAVETPLDGFENVGRRVLAACVSSSPQCVGWFGGQDPWLVWVRTLDAAGAGVLPCNAALKDWNVPSYRAAYANIAAMLLASSSDPYTTPVPVATQAFFPAFVYRLQRCNAHDVAALTKLYATLNGTKGTVQPTGQCAVNTALQFNVIINELLPSPGSAPAPASVLTSISLRAVQPNPDYFVAVAAAAATWPLYAVSAAEKSYGDATVPTALLAGDADVFTPTELAEYAVAMYYKRATQAYVPIARGAHPLLATSGRSCVAASLVALAEHRSVATLPNCGASAVPAYDFFGSTTPSSTLVQYLGVDDLWAYSTPTPPVGPTPIGPSPPPPSPTPPPITPSPSGDAPPPPTSDKNAVIALAILCTLTWVAVIVYALYRRGCFHRKKDFYSELNR